METSNPVLKENTFAQARNFESTDSMTIQGVVNKTFILFGIFLAGAAWMWSQVMQSAVAGDKSGSVLIAVGPYIGGGALVGFLVAMVTCFKAEWAKVTAPIYALCEGLALGGISAIMEIRYPGIAIQAVALTTAALFSLLTLYSTGIIKATERFKSVIFIATMAIAVTYFVEFILGFFHRYIPVINTSSMGGIIFSLVVVGVAALNLIIDFDFIEQNANRQTAKYMEWYAAFSLMVTLVWLYMEILRLLGKLRDRR